MISWEGKRISWRVKGLVKGNVWSKGKKKRWRWGGSRSGFRIWYCAWPRYPWPCASEPYLSGGQTSAQTDHGKHLWPEKDLSGGGGIHKGGNIDRVYLWVPVATSIVQPFTNTIKHTVWGLLPVTAGCTNHCLYHSSDQVFVPAPRCPQMPLVLVGIQSGYVRNLWYFGKWENTRLSTCTAKNKIGRQKTWQYKFKNTGILVSVG